MKGNHNRTSNPSKRLVHLLLPLIAIGAMLAPSSAQAGCMDGKLSCFFNYMYNDTKNMLLMSAKIDYHPAISPSVTTRVECNQVSDGTADLTCNSSVYHAFVYYVKANGTTRIKNPGMNDVCEKICNGMGVAVYYVNGGQVY